MPIVDESKQNKGVNNNTRNKQMAIDMEYYNRLNHLRFKSPYLGAKYQQRAIPVRTLNGVQDVFVDNRGTIKQGGQLIQEQAILQLQPLRQYMIILKVLQIYLRIQLKLVIIQ